MQLETREDLIVGTLHRNGINVFTATLPYRSQPCDISEVWKRVNFIKNINLKIIPQIDLTRGIRQITSRDSVDVDVTECWAGLVTNRIEENVQVPLYRLPVFQHLEVYYWKGVFSLIGGAVLHEY